MSRRTCSEDKRQSTRRDFLRRTAALTAGAAAAPYIIPASALGQGGATAPSNRIVLGCIGMGSMGMGNMRGFLGMPDIHIAAVCDVDRNRREAAREEVNARYGDEGCAGYNDFRELLARPDLDAVSIAVPDHWHAIPAIAAAERGLDIYAEKPLALTIGQGRAMADAVARYGVVWQTGSWQRSHNHFRLACELVRNGRIGKVHTVEVGLPTGSPCPPQPEMPVPEGFDYDFWLGPAPVAPYTEKRCHWNFRWILDYSGGQLTDWAAHHCDIANWGMGTEYTGPAEVSGEGDFPRDGLWNAATDYHVEARYPAGVSPVAPEGFAMRVSNGYPMGAKFIGEEGVAHVSRGGLSTEPASLAESEVAPNEIHLYESVNHSRNFVDCVRSRAETITPIEVAHRAITIAHLGNIAMRLERPVRWDPEAEVIVNDPQAQRMTDRAMRGGWHL
jgi:predicted dehydrogenase